MRDNSRFGWRGYVFYIGMGINVFELVGARVGLQSKVESLSEYGTL
jgi:hypothetical protein